MRDDTEREELFTARPIEQSLENMLAKVRAADPAGAVADYIPELAKADPELLGISAVTLSGRAYGAGDRAARFTIQSISKPFVYALALAELGMDTMLERIGVEPSGQAFNAISFDERGRPANPLINAGAVVTTSLIGGRDAEERFERIRAGLSAFAGRELDPDDSVYRSESSTGDRNRALAALARSFGVLGSSVDDATEAYFRQCALLVDTSDLALMGATLANNGVNPITGQRVVEATIARNALSVMTSCGMYDRSGEWLFKVGMPAKSGVGGGIVAVAPGQYGIGVFSPPLDQAGNSSRGVLALETLSDQFGLHMYNHQNHPASPVQEITLDAATGTVVVRVRGTVDFVAAEILIQASISALRDASAHALVLDLANVTAIGPIAGRLIDDLAREATKLDYRVTVIDPEGLLAV
ncbi:MAG: glutaminase A [Leucobacter sp.]